MMKLTGKIWKVGDDVDTDQIIPARYLVTSDSKELAPHCLEDTLPGFASRVRPGDVLVAGRNFGCGSSREHAPIAIKGAGISCVIARSFARIFYRNSFNMGLPILECPEASEALREGERIAVDIATGIIEACDRGLSFKANPIPPFMRDLLESGGLLPYIAKHKRLKVA